MSRYLRLSLALLIGFALLFTVGAQDTPEERPLTLPPMASLAFKEKAHRVLEALEAGDLSEAREAAELLPDMPVEVAINEETLPQDRAVEIRQAVRDGLAIWQEAYDNFTYEVVDEPNPDLLISFVPRLEPREEGEVPPGVAIINGFSRQEPQIEAVIALRRGHKGLPADNYDIANEVAFGVGAYLGLAEQPSPGYIMGRVEGSRFGRLRIVSPRDRLFYDQNRLVVERLKQATESGDTPPARDAKALINPLRLEFEPVDQGEVLTWGMQVTNQGDGDLMLEAVPNCRCLVVRSERKLAPGETRRIQVWANTADFPGPFSKKIYLYTNDPEIPVREIPVEGYVEPAYEFVREGDSETIYVPEEGKVERIVLAVDPDRPFEILDTELSGASGTVHVEEWQGEVTDDETGITREAVGYEISLFLSPTVTNNRTLMSLTVETDSEDFPFLRYTTHVQGGVAADPVSVFFGALGEVPKSVTVLVRHPALSFNVLEVTSDHPSVRAEIVDETNPSEKVVRLMYNGEAAFGPLQGTLTITLDQRPYEIVVPFRGEVE
jgi:hypothetical protein